MQLSFIKKTGTPLLQLANHNLKNECSSHGLGKPEFVIFLAMTVGYDIVALGWSFTDWRT